MKGYFRNFLLITVPSLIVLGILLELLFRFLIPASQIPHYAINSATQLPYYTNYYGDSGVFTTGKFAEIQGTWKINNHGYNSPYNYTYNRTNKKRICVIGDSFVDGVHLPLGKRFQDILQDSLNLSEIFSFGISGMPLSNHIITAKKIDSLYNPDIIIIILIHNDFSESVYQPGRPFWSINHSNLGYKFNPPHAIKKKPTLIDIDKILNNFSIFRYLKHNLKAQYSFKEKESHSEDRSEIEKLTRFSLGKLVQLNSNVILVMDAPRFDIYKNNLKNSNEIWKNKMVRNICNDYKIELIDLTSIFKSDFSKNGKPFNFESDGHWNEYGHYIVAKELMLELKNE